jgi:hypothetical protein
MLKNRGNPEKASTLLHWIAWNRVDGEKSCFEKSYQRMVGTPIVAGLRDVRTDSLHAFAMRNFTTVLAGIWMDSPVLGFLPILALRSTSTSFPIPGIVKEFGASL